MILEQPTNTSPTGAKCQHNLTLIGDLAAELKVHKVFLTRNKPSPHHPHISPFTIPHTHTHSHTHTHTHRGSHFFRIPFQNLGLNIVFDIFHQGVHSVRNVRNFRNIGKKSGKCEENFPYFYFVRKISRKCQKFLVLSSS